MQNNSKLWWPICLSKSVSSKKPVGLHLNEIALAVYRDGSNNVRAVEDRCPHRRAPLSLGRITKDGDIQCGYHGWTFNGETGDICGFPNLDEGERLPRCSIETFTIIERNGVVYLGLGDQLPSPVSVTQDSQSTTSGQLLHGKSMQGLPHQEAVAAFLDNPNYFLNILGVEFVDKILGDPKVEDGLLVCERAGRWNLLGESRLYLGPLRHRADFPLRLQTITAPITGETLIRLYADEHRLLTQMLVTFTPSVRSMTAIHWQATVYPQAWGLLQPLIKGFSLLKQSSVSFHKYIDYVKLSEELPSAGAFWQSLMLPED